MESCAGCGRPSRARERRMTMTFVEHHARVVALIEAFLGCRSRGEHAKAREYRTALVSLEADEMDAGLRRFGIEPWGGGSPGRREPKP